MDATDRRHRTAKRTKPTGRIALLGLIAVAGACVFGGVSSAAGATAPSKLEGERLSVAKTWGRWRVRQEEAGAGYSCSRAHWALARRSTPPARPV